jgi:hypothetical protein
MKLAQYLSVKQIISVDEDVYKIYGDEKEWKICITKEN